LLDIHDSVPNRKFKERSSSTSARPNCSFGYSGFFARLQPIVGVCDLASAQDLSVNVAIETCR
jgi:hypothetical protein